MPTKTLTKKDKSRALKLGLAVLKTEKRFAAQQDKERKAAEDLKKAAKKVKVEDGPGNLYKVKVEGKEYLLDRNGYSDGGEPSEKSMPAVKEAILLYSHKRISVTPSKTKYGMDGVYFNDSDGRECCYHQSSLACEDTCWLRICDHHSIHLSESKNDRLIEAICRVSGGTRSVTITDRYGNKFNVKPNDGGVVITILTYLVFDSKGREVKKKLAKNNVMRFDAKAAEVLRSILDKFTSFERNFKS